MKTTLKKFTNSGIKNFRSMVFAAFLLAAGSVQAQTYCTPATGDCSDSDEITNVTFAGINNNSTCTTGGYSNFSSSVAAAQVIAGQTYPLTVTVPAHTGNESVAAWIDFNGNGTFDTAEFFYLGLSPAAGSTLTINIAVPATAVGTVRLRLKAQYSQALTAAGSCTAPYLGYGEFEDYSVVVTPNTICSGTPVVGTPTSSVVNACAANTFTITAPITPAAGLSFQWQSSTDAGANWANLGTAQVSSTYSVTGQAVASSYRVIVTCTGSSLSTTSASVAVGQNPYTNCYCTNAFNMICGEGDVITNVLFGTLDNSSACGNATTGYTSYLTTVTPPVVRLGDVIDASVTVGPSGDGWLYESVGIWIDFNHNGAFDASEYTSVGTGLDEALSVAITIPTTALIGQTRMRVVVAASTAAGFSAAYSCGSLSATNNYGEMEDYLIDIQPALATPGFNSSNFAMYPNPTTGIVNIKFGNATAVNAINVYSISGQLVFSKQFNTSSDNYSIDLQKASTGVYIVKIETENGTQVNRLIKN